MAMGMRKLRSLLLGSALLVASCAPAGEGEPGFVDQAGNWLSDAADSSWSALRPVLGTGTDFMIQVVRRGCGDSPFVGKSPVETLAHDHRVSPPTPSSAIRTASARPSAPSACR